MNVAVLLPPMLVERARIGLRCHYTVIPVATVGELERLLRAGTPDVVVIDPLTATTGELTRLILAGGRTRAVPFVMYTTLSAEAMRAVAALAHAGVAHLVLAGYDDQPPMLTSVVDSLPPTTFSAQFLDRLHVSLAAMPPELRAAIRHLFRAPREIRSTVDLASAGRLNLRTLDRWIGRAGLASPGAVISCARLVRACWLLRMARCRLSDASDRAGFPSIRSLRHRLVATTGLSPSLLRAADSTASILDRFEASVRSA